MVCKHRKCAIILVHLNIIWWVEIVIRGILGTFYNKT